jgi:hypothetical protein
MDVVAHVEVEKLDAELGPFFVGRRRVPTLEIFVY